MHQSVNGLYFSPYQFSSEHYLPGCVTSILFINSFAILALSIRMMLSSYPGLLLVADLQLWELCCQIFIG